MGAVHRVRQGQGFRDQLAEARSADPDPAIQLMVQMFNPIHKTLCSATETMDDELRRIARESNLARRLMTVRRVGPVVSLSCIAMLDDAGRFKKSTDFGAFLGLTPRRHQSGDLDWYAGRKPITSINARHILFNPLTKSGRG